MTATGNNYAEALFMLAREENLIDEFYEGLKMVEEVFTNIPEYLQFLATPSIPKSERTAALAAAFEGKVNAHVLSFLCVMCEQGKTEQFFLVGVIARFRNGNCNRIVVHIFTNGASFD